MHILLLKSLGIFTKLPEPLEMQVIAKQRSSKNASGTQNLSLNKS
jgi:hypothetical protein